MIGHYSVLISSSIIIKYAMDKSGVTDFIYNRWCNFINRKKEIDSPIFKDLTYEDEDQEKVLTLGCRDNGSPIKVNMNIDSHMLIIGLSNSGKSKLAEQCLQDKKSITVLNAFKEDFQTLQADFINGNENILQYLISCLNGRTIYSETHYVLIDELLVLMKDKKIEKTLSDLLAIARHFNVYIIAISQEGTKEVLKCKNLFNVRVCMKLLEESSIRTVLGCSVPVDDRMLKQREFYVVDNQGLRRGESYDMNADQLQC